MNRMKIHEIITSIIEKEVQFNGLTLLSKEEYFKLKENIPDTNFWWWLRSPGFYDNFAAVVDYNNKLGSSYVDSNYVDYTGGSVRPALILNLDSSLKVGDKFRFYNHNWTVISEQYALCDEAFCKMWFRNDWMAEDGNVYELSDIKKYIDDEWTKMTLEE